MVEVLETRRDDAIIRRTLSKSKLRRDILRGLMSEDMYQYELARKIGSDSSNVKGGVEGLEPRYSVARSLAALGLVTVWSDGVYKYYGLTKKGRWWYGNL